MFNFLFKKIDSFLGVNSNITVQKMVEYFYILPVLRYGHVKYLSNKRNQSSLSFLWPEIFCRKSTKFFVALVILNAPSVCGRSSTPGNKLCMKTLPDAWPVLGTVFITDRGVPCSVICCQPSPRQHGLKMHVPKNCHSLCWLKVAVVRQLSHSDSWS